jgi:hypothetical protein
MKIYIYLKTHNQTGLKYLGQTTQDPYQYRGSGTRWLNHIKKHGYDVKTEILKVCSSYDEVKIFGKQFSEHFDIVRSPQFANLVEETGHEFRLPTNFEEINQKRSKTLSGFKRKWVTNGRHNRLLKKDDPIPEGFFPGRTWDKDRTVSAETKAKMRESALARPKIGITKWEKSCEYCSQDFMVTSEQKHQRFCSRSCSAKARTSPQNPSGRNQYSK